MADIKTCTSRQREGSRHDLWVLAAKPEGDHGNDQRAKLHWMCGLMCPHRLARSTDCKGYDVHLSMV